MEKHKEIRPPSSYLPLLLAAILLDEICNNYLLGVFNEREVFQKAILYGSFILLQILISPIQAGFSDFYCRKRSLVASLCCSTVSLFFVFFYFQSFFSQFLALFIALFVKGAFGNTLPIAWAGIYDTKNHDYRFSLGLSTSTIAVGYLVLIVIETIFNEQRSLVFISLLFIFLIPTIWNKLIDLVDRREEREHLLIESGSAAQREQAGIKYFFKLLSIDLKGIKDRFLKSARFRAGLFGVFLPLEISFYSTHALGVDLAVQRFKFVTISMILGYLCGVGVLKYCKSHADDVMINRGYQISISSFLPMFIAAPLLSLDQFRWVIVFCYFAYSFGVAFIVPSLFSTISKEREPHEQGKIYGLVDSTDTVALLFALIAGIIYTYFQAPIYVICFSFVLFLISRAFYARFNKVQGI